MDPISIFDIFKIGVGPSSSHTLGPWKAASQFVSNLNGADVDQIDVDLFDSLSKTGKGHATDLAVQLGLEQHDPEFIDTTKINEMIGRILMQNRINIGSKQISFNPLKNIIFHSAPSGKHPNTIVFRAYNKGEAVLSETYFSVGGGFIVKEGENKVIDNQITLPYPIIEAIDLLKHVDELKKPISEVVFLNELAYKTRAEIKAKIKGIFDTMVECVYRGCTSEGFLPGGLMVKRRAKGLNTLLLGQETFNSKEEWIEAIQKCPKDFATINRWVSCFAIAVNEENADLGRVVTSPTNGASGVIPAVILYYYFFCKNEGMDAIERFFLTSGEIGCMFKKGATISAAVGGCQAEIGVSSAMAAGGLTEIMGGTPEQVLMASEIAMEHHLGLTCDPIGGLVQIPCIERNTMGAMKAITASNLALSGDPKDSKVHFDMVVKTMWDTAQEMNHKYKETSEGGLAVNYPEC
ncbi:MAG: L-serine ammonia-lyase [Crocinitomicaceae bacterium]|nr:L-serine ammonia-lyase [Crocinitomicaceae bacterium]